MCLIICMHILFYSVTDQSIFLRQLNDNQLAGSIPPELGKLGQLFEL